jgi:adenylate cyclase
MSIQAAAVADPARSQRGSIVWERMLRLWSGLIIFGFLFFHLLNHAVGLFGLEAMRAAQEIRWEVIGNDPLTIVLYSAFFVHMALALKRVVGRQTWRMPVQEAVQIALGCLIPVFLVGHVVNTRVALMQFEADLSYAAVLSRMWPDGAWWQTTLVLVAWTHGCIGLHHFLRFRPFYIRWQTAALILAVLIPVLALAGFVASGREAQARPDGPADFTAEEQVRLSHASRVVYGAFGAAGILAFGLVGGSYLRRRAAQQIVIAYRGRGTVRVPKGTSVLEASRRHGIPHPSVCGGRGRCSTCRVHILSRTEHLPEPNLTEKTLLTAIGAPADVRLACQLRPTDSLSLRILLPVLGRDRTDLTDEESREWAVQQPATVLSVDLRAFNTIARNQQPYEVAVLVNRFRSEMIQAVRHHNGEVAVFYGDGLVAYFGDASDRHAGSREALHAAGDVARVLDGIHREMGSALSLPIRAGIGIHTGATILARIGDDARDAAPMALGPTVTIAQILQEGTKEALADCLVSDSTAIASGYDFGGLFARDFPVPGQAQPVRAYALADCAAVFALLSRGARTVEPEAATEEIQ